MRLQGPLFGGPPGVHSLSPPQRSIPYQSAVTVKWNCNAFCSAIFAFTFMCFSSSRPEDGKSNFGAILCRGDCPHGEFGAKRPPSYGGLLETGGIAPVWPCVLLIRP